MTPFFVRQSKRGSTNKPPFQACFAAKQESVGRALENRLALTAIATPPLVSARAIVEVNPSSVPPIAMVAFDPQLALPNLVVPGPVQVVSPAYRVSGSFSELEQVTLPGATGTSAGTTVSRLQSPIICKLKSRRRLRRPQRRAVVPLSSAPSIRTAPFRPATRCGDRCRCSCPFPRESPLSPACNRRSLQLTNPSRRRIRRMRRGQLRPVSRRSVPAVQANRSASPRRRQRTTVSTVRWSITSPAKFQCRRSL